MDFYPLLTAEQQQALPSLIRPAELMLAQFEDSTHRLWKCDTTKGSLILKVCNSYDVAKSTFWQGMTMLFDVDLPNQLAEFEQVFKVVANISPLTIPDYIASASATEDEPAFIAAQELSGLMVEADIVNDDMVISLANHIACLHQATQPMWGRIGHINLDAEQWPQRLQNTLEQLVETQEMVIPDELLNEVLEQVEQCTVDQFVPIMPDLRWDQFLQRNGKLSALVDLDAFVVGPRELELVLIEYLLDDQQARVFEAHYQQTCSLPDLSQVRKPYRLLLFMMNVLGETDIDTWMEASIRW